MKVVAVSTSLARLEARHRDLDTAVSAFDRRLYLTPNEQRHVAAMKKEKLVTKDRIAKLRRSEPPPG
jgi:hypothetical protein